MHVLTVEGHIGHLTLYISENPKNILSYQASSSYNLEEFPGVITPILMISAIMQMIDGGVLGEWLLQPVQLEEYLFVTCYS